MPGPFFVQSARRLVTFSFLTTVAFTFVSKTEAQSAAVVARSAQVTAVDLRSTTRLGGHVPEFADASKVPSSPMASDGNFARLTIVLNRAPSVEQAFEQLLSDQVNPASPRYHHWLLPDEVGNLYGPAPSDVNAVTNWLHAQGLNIVEVSPSRTLITFGGTVSAVAAAFQTSFRIFSLANGESRYSLVTEPTVPTGLSPAIKNISGLSQVIHRPASKRSERVETQSLSSISPSLNSSTGKHYLVAGDFAKAYDMNSSYSAGYTGAGQNIAVVGESRVNASDVANLQTLQGQTVKQPNTIVPPTGADPGTPGDTSGKENGFQDEATLDVDRTLGNAPGSQVDLVVSADVNGGTTYATDGLFLSINYAINTLNDPILSVSFGGCEGLNGAQNTNYESSIFQTAAAQGISTFVSSGDDGAAACNAFSTSTTSYANVLSINDLCSGPYVTCMGGTEFADSTNPAAYWSSNGADGTSLISYIPEGAWNDVSLSSTTNTYSEGGSGGGVSTVIAKPTWQIGTGVPRGSFRWVPDIALTSSTHDGFVTCLKYLGADCVSTGFYAFGGTSAAAPSMAAIQAITNQKLGGRQGNLNPLLYALGGSFSNAFHDVTVASSGVSPCSISTPSLCNNSLPGTATLSGGLTGYLVTTGWDAVTGWGSLDVANYIKAVSSVGFTVAPAATALSLAPVSGNTVTDLINLTSVDGFSGIVALACTAVTSSGTAVGTCSLSSPSVSLTAGGYATTQLTVANTGTTSGALTVVVTGTSGASIVSTPGITVTVSTGSFTLMSTVSPLIFTSGAIAANKESVILATTNFTGSVNLNCTLSSSSAYYQPTCSVNPATVSLSPAGTVTAAVTINSTTAVTVAQSNKAVGARIGFGAAFITTLLLLLSGRRKAFRGSVALTLIAAILGSIAGCGSGGIVTSATPVTTVRSSTGTYTVTVSGTGTPNGGTVAPTASTTFTVIIN